MKKSILISFLLLIFLFLSIAPLAAGDRICATCGKVIVGSYKEYMGKPYCSMKCVEEVLPRCSVCNRSLADAKGQRKFFKVNDRIFCSEECYLSALPTCRICGKSLQQWLEFKNHKYCEDCARLPKCLNCRLPGADKQLADGRHICSACLETAIVEKEQAEDLFREVRDDIYKHLNLRTGHRIEFYMVDADKLAAVIGRRSSTEQGFYSFNARYRTLRGVKSLQSETCAIYLLSALSPSYFRNAAAHELAHDLGHALFPNVLKEEDVEGFAEYISSMMNSYWGNDSLNEEKLRNQERNYAAAYRKFLKLAEQNGLADVMDYMEKQNQSPTTRDIKGKRR